MLTTRDAESVALRERLEALEGVLSEHGIRIPRGENPPEPIMPASKEEDEVANVISKNARARTGRPSAQHAASSSGVHMPPPSFQSASAAKSASPAGKLDNATANAQDFSPSMQGTYGNNQTFDRQSSVHFGMDSGPLLHPASVESVHFDFSTEDNAFPPPAHHRTLSASQPSPVEDTSFGTLVMGHGGRSKYLGPTAASEWLRDVSNLASHMSDVSQKQESDAPSESPGPSRWPSPERHNAASASDPMQRSAVFPFDGTYVPLRTRALLSRLPPIQEARVLVDSYFRYFSWQ